jgi:colicin import membrane protein
MAKSKKKQKAEAALKASRANTVEGRKEQAAAEAAAAEAAREKAEAEAAAAAARKGPTPKAVKVKRPRHVRPARRAQPAATTAPTPARSTFAGMLLAHSVRKSMPKAEAKPLEVKRAGSNGSPRG